MSIKPRILIIDDEPTIRITVSDSLRNNGYEVFDTDSGVEGLNLVKNNQFDIVITDLKLPQVGGIEILNTIKKVSPRTVVILITAYGTVETAVKAMKDGAYDYLTKPFVMDELLLIVQRVIQNQRLEIENIMLRQEIEGRYRFENIVGKSPKMQAIFSLIKIVADTDSTVLIQGETGTGKELIANAIHYSSNRRESALIKVNCAALPETLLETELFGHEKGAFTGAIKQKKGRFELADGGTIFLDEVSELSQSVQIRLLRVLQEREFERVGGTACIKVDVRVICASKEDLKKLMEKGVFREDLFYRINVVPINIPPLREHKEDIPLLVEHFISQYSKKMGKSIQGVLPEVMTRLMSFDFPGNVRQLENAIERAVALCGDNMVNLSHLPEDFQPHSETFERSGQIRPLDVVLKEYEKDYIINVLKSVNGKKGKAADLLGISRKSLWEKLKSYRIEKIGIISD